MSKEFKPEYTFTDDRLNELKQLFPEAWEDGVFNVDTLKELIGEYSTDNSVKEHFGLNWVGKKDARKIAAKPPTGTLKPCPGEGVNEDNTENIFIEGENLEVLKILRKSYMGKIKMIYIDPPYNTGNDFIYNDTFADSTEDYLTKTGEKSDEGLLVSNPKSSGKYHANWLTFMYPRIRLSKDLLKEDGVIFLSIDDNEYDNLKKVCDEVFGEENMVASFIVVRSEGGGLAKQAVTGHDYLLAYAKNIGKFEPLKKPKDIRGKRVFKDNEEYWIEEDWLRKEFGKYGTCPYNEIEKYHGQEKKTEIDQGILSGKYVLIEKKGETIVGRYRKISEDGSKFYTILKHLNKNGVEDLKRLGLEKYFSFPKPTSLIESLVHGATFFKKDQNEIILDFFSGSGTTAESVINVNEKFGGNRKFIVVQLPETINEKHPAYKSGYRKISEVTKTRIKKSIELSDKKCGFKSYSLNTHTINKWRDFKPQEDGLLPDLFTKLESAFKNPLVEGTTPEEFITEVMLQEGFPLTAKQTEVQDDIFKISHDWVPYTLYVSMLQSFKDIDLEALGLSETDHFVCLDMAFENNDALKQTVDNQCKLFTV